MSGRVLVVEDEEGLVMSLEDRLRSEGYEVKAVGDGVRGQDEAMTGSFDVIVLDVMLPGRDGFQVCQNLREAGIRTPVIMLTARSTTIDTVMGLRIGADDYLTKPFEMQILLARIHALLRRSENLEAAGEGRTVVHDFGDFRLDTDTHQLSRGEELIELSAQEYRLLEFFVKNPLRVLSRDELLNEAWGYDSETTTRTVDVHVSWLRQKLGDTGVNRYLITVRGYGYKFVPGE